MSKTRLRLITIFSLAVLFVLSLSLAIGVLPVRRAAHAEARNYSPSSIFSAYNNAVVSSDRPSENASEEETYWVQFTLKGDDDNVSYRKPLALKWFEAAEADPSAEDGAANPGAAKYFTMKFSFPAINFTEFDIVFESAEENITKDGQTTNSLHFVRGTDPTLRVSVRDAYFDEEEEDKDSETFTDFSYTNGQDITVALSESGEENREGNFDVTLTVGEDSYTVGSFKNIGGYYIEWRSSGTSTPQTPITFSATFPKTAAFEPQTVLMKELNGQTFEVGKDGVTENGKPMLALSQKVYPFPLGQRFSLDSYMALNVCSGSFTPTRNYYMLTRNEDGSFKKPAESGTEDYKTLTTSTFFMPTSDEQEDEAYVSIRFTLSNSVYSDYYVYLTWYAADTALVTKANDGYICSKCGKEYTASEYEALADGAACTGKVGEGEEEQDCSGTKADLVAGKTDAFDYILVNRRAEGPGYIGVEASEEQKTNIASEQAAALAQAYQEQLDRAAENVSAGDGAYLYLPSLRPLISSDYADYRTLRFSVYYYKPGATAGSTASSATSLRYNNLRIEVDEVGEYRFRVIAQDAASNAMKYIDEDGELVTLTSSNVWDIDGIPEFSFYVDYEGPTIEEAGAQSDGYRDRTYSVSDFDIVALEGYKKEYTLYYLNETVLREQLEKEAAEGETVDLPAYSDLVDNIDEWIEKFETWDAAKKETEPKILRTIDKYNSEVTEDDEDEWERTDNDYAWNPSSSLSFVPQETGTYFVKIDVTDAYLVNKTTSAYQAIFINNPIESVSRPTQWLQDNIVAVVLFSISAVLFVAIVVLFVVKPSDKTVEEVDLDKLKGSKKGKKKE